MENIGFRGNINHITKNMLKDFGMVWSQNQTHVTTITRQLQINEYKCQECKCMH